MNTITAIIPTFNEATTIEQALQSVQWADEILVVDSFSTDDTVAIAEKYAKVIQHEYINSASQKNWIIPQATHDWIFLLDADEVCTPALQNEIKKTLSKPPKESCFWIKRQNFYMDKKIRFSGWQDDRVIRLFKKENCRYQDLHVHAEIETTGKVGKLKQKIEHHTYKNLASVLEKVDRYSTWGAYDRVGKTKNIGFAQLVLKPIWRFTRHYILRFGVLDGKRGFIIASIAAYTIFIRSLKIWRIKEGESFKK